MPEFTWEDRQLLHAESTTWAALAVLDGIDIAGAFIDEVDEVRKNLQTLARKLRDYNNQFEVDT